MQCLGHIQLAKLHYIISQNSSCLRILKYYFSYKTNVLCLQQYILTSECLSTSISTSRYYVAHLICSHCKCLYSNYSHGIVKTNQNYKQLLIELNTYKIYTFYSHSIVLLSFEHIETSIIWL